METPKLIKTLENEISETNQRDMLRILHDKYKQLEQFTCLASPDTVKEHNQKLENICIGIAELKAVLKSHLESDEKTQLLIEKLFDRAETNSGRINTLETINKVLGGIIGGFLIIWTTGRVIFKQ